MKRIGMRFFLVGLASLAVGCAAAPGRLAGDPLELRDGSVAVTPSTQPADPGGSRLRLVGRGFAVRDFRVIRDEYGRVHVLGEVQNVGAATHGVELQAALRDANGRLLSVGHFCPAAGNNIAPGEVWPFTYSFGRQDQGVRAELRVVDAFRSMGDTW